MADTEMKHSVLPAESEDDAPAETDPMEVEVCFWREMIQSRGSCLPPEAIERMQFALELAERRLQCRRAKPEYPCNNVISLEQARRIKR